MRFADISTLILIFAVMAACYKANHLDIHDIPDKGDTLYSIDNYGNRTVINGYTAEDDIKTIESAINPPNPPQVKIEQPKTTNIEIVSSDTYQLKETPYELKSSCDWEVDDLKLDLESARNIIRDFECYCPDPD